MQALEGAEQLARIMRVEAGAVVLDIETLSLCWFDGADADARSFGPGGEFPCVPEQIVEQDLQHGGIRLDRNARVNPHFDLPGRARSPFDLRHRALCHRRYIHRNAVQFRTRDLG